MRIACLVRSMDRDQLIALGQKQHQLTQAQVPGLKHGTDWGSSTRAAEVLLSRISVERFGTQRVRRDFSSHRRCGKQLVERSRVQCQARRTDPRVLSSRRRCGIQIYVHGGRDLGSRGGVASRTRQFVGCSGRSCVLVWLQEARSRCGGRSHRSSRIFLSGARPALPMGVAPEAMFGC